MGWPAVQGYENGQQIVAGVLNKPLNQLAERTEYLRNLITSHGSTKVTVDVTISDPGGYGYPAVGQPVYRVSDGTYALAAGITGENEWFYAEQSAMAVGVVSAVSGTTATVVLYGLLDFSTTGITASTVIADATPVSGRYYLSATHGKLTSSPSGPVIYVCDCLIGQVSGVYKILSMLVSPQYRDTGESHIHRSFVIDGKPAGDYAIKVSGQYLAYGIRPTGVTPTAGTAQTGATIALYGSWDTDTSVTYALSIVKNDEASSTGWDGYNLRWTSNGDDGSGYITLPALSGTSLTTGLLTVGTHGLLVKLSISSSSVTPSSQTSKAWSVTMPSAARAWVNYYDDDDDPVGYRLNLGMYPAMARYVPPMPANGAAMTVGGVEMRSTIFGDTKEWEIMPADDDGGPWLVWYGGDIVGDGSTLTTPFTWPSGTTQANKDTTIATSRDIVLHLNRMRVGPTGFVTSLQVADGSPLKITSAQTDAEANQGALQIAMDVDFTTDTSNVAGNMVVKRIVGSKFETGPVVEMLKAGPGVDLSPEGGQGTVTVSVSGAHYAGDFETIALKNAKQDLAGGVFPYTKLLGWAQSGTNVNTGFTAKFRVPDYLPYGSYNVVVSASVFGEVATSGAALAAFSIANYMLKDYSLNSTEDETGFAGSIANPTAGQTATVNVALGSSSSNYVAFDPVTIHGFSDVTGTAQRQYFANLLLKDSSGNAIVVKPGYFVGLDINRCGVTGSGTWYTSPVGFLSLRWNLVGV